MCAWAWGDTARARDMLTADPDLARVNIYTASVTGEVETVKAILAAEPGAATTKGGPQAWEPLLHVAWSPFVNERTAALVATAKLLLAHGADPNCSWHNKTYDATETALYGACGVANCADLTRSLLEAGADPNDGESLYHACEHRDTACLDLLHEHGLTEDLSHCIKHILDHRYHEGVLWFLEHGADPNATHPAADETALHWAVKRGNAVETIKALLDHGADPNARTREGRSAYLRIKGWTPLDTALRLGQVAVADLLRQRGAVEGDYDAVDRYLFACARADRQAVTALQAEHPDIQSRIDAADMALVAHVGQMQNFDGVRLMAEVGFDLRAQGWDGATALHWACCHGHAETVKFLLDRGAPLVAAAGSFGTPLHTTIHCQWGRDGDHPQVLRHLLEAGCDVPEGAFPTGNAALDAVYRGCGGG